MYYWIYIGENEIGEKGCRYLSKAEWKEMEEINLSICYLTQMKIKLAIRAVNTFLMETGPELKSFGYVFI